MRRILLFFALFALAANAGGIPFIVESESARVDLIELFTSEGCSSCPSAEKSLGDLRNDDRLWSAFVPVAFHVHYWDRLGWRDRFASREFTKRQYAYAEAWNDHRVYTPCFVRNGREWRGGNPVPQRRPEAGVLRVAAKENREVILTFTPSRDTGEDDFVAHVALLGGDIESRIGSGENRGRTLEHHFVALSLETVSMQAADGETFRARLSIPEVEDLETEPNALAAWITRGASIYPVQAVGGWLNEPSNR